MKRLVAALSVVLLGLCVDVSAQSPVTGKPNVWTPEQEVSYLRAQLVGIPKNASVRLSEPVKCSISGRDVLINSSYAGSPDHSRQPLVLIHGTPSSLFSWASVVSSPDESFQGLAVDYDVYSLDLPGHGLSSALKEYSWAAMTEAVAQFVSAKGIKRPIVLVGNSYGGEVAWRFALDHSDLVRALVLVDSSGFAREDMSTSELFFKSSSFECDAAPLTYLLRTPTLPDPNSFRIDSETRIMIGNDSTKYSLAEWRKQVSWPEAGDNSGPARPASAETKVDYDGEVRFLSILPATEHDILIGTLQVGPKLIATRARFKNLYALRKLFSEHVTPVLRTSVSEAFSTVPDDLDARVLELECVLGRWGNIQALFAMSRIEDGSGSGLLPKLNPRIPVLVLWGDSDHIIPINYGERFRDTLREARGQTGTDELPATGVSNESAVVRWHPISACGHMPQEEQPRVFVELVRNFLVN